MFFIEKRNKPAMERGHRSPSRSWSPSRRSPRTWSPSRSHSRSPPRGRYDDYRRGGYDRRGRHDDYYSDRDRGRRSDNGPRGDYYGGGGGGYREYRGRSSPSPPPYRQPARDDPKPPSMPPWRQQAQICDQADQQGESLEEMRRKLQETTALLEKTAAERDAALGKRSGSSTNAAAAAVAVPVRKSKAFEEVSSEELQHILVGASARGEVMSGRTKRKAALNSGLARDEDASSKQAKVSVPDEDDDEEAEFEF